MSTLLDVVAHFETSLVDPIDENSSSMELETVTTAHGDIPDGTYGFTIEHNSNSKREYVVGTLDSSTKTVTFTKRDVSVLDATTEDASSDNDRQTHRKGANIRFTNHPALQRITRLLEGSDQMDPANRITYSGSVTPASDNELVTKEYVLSVVTGGSVSFDRQIIAGDAGEAISSGDRVYFKESDGKWYQLDASNEDHVNSNQKGIALGSGTSNNAISNGIQISGLYGSGYTAGQTYYGQDTAGSIGTTTGTRVDIVGVGDLNGKLVLFDDPNEVTPNQKKFLSAVTGMVVMYAADSAPDGFLLCNGQAVSRSTYSDLFAIIGTSYGTGDGSTTFNVPDFRSALPVGYGQKTKTFDFVDGDVNTSTDVITVDSNDYLHTGQEVTLSNSGGALPTGLSAGTYHIIRVSSTTIKLATSVSNANSGTAVDITAASGSGTHTLTLTLTDRSIGDEGGTETQTTVPSHKHTTNALTDPPSGGGGGSDSAPATTAVINATGEDEPNNMPPYVGINYIIKT